MMMCIKYWPGWWYADICLLSISTTVKTGTKDRYSWNPKFFPQEQHTSSIVKLKLCNWVQNNTHCISFHFYGDSKKKVSWIQKEKWENYRKIKFSTHEHDSGLLHWRGPFGVIWLINHPAPQWQIDNCPVIYEWDPLSPEVRTKVFCPCFSTFSKHF